MAIEPDFTAATECSRALIGVGAMVVLVIHWWNGKIQFLAIPKTNNTKRKADNARCSWSIEELFKINSSLISRNLMINIAGRKNIKVVKIWVCK